MKRFFQLMAVIAMTAILAGTAYARTWDDHIAQAPNGKGDTLIYPIYSAEDGWETKIQVVNTSLTSATVAKVSVFTGPYSVEVLDFLIFLTPTDMWEGVLRVVDGQVIMYSEDDSTLTSYFPTFASAEAPFVAPLAPSGYAPCGDTDEFGYVLVDMGWVWDNAIPGTPDTFPGMPKMVYDADGTPRFDRDSLYQRYLQYIDSNRARDPIGGAAAADAREFTNVNILAGNLEILNVLLNQSAALSATTMKNNLFRNALTVERRQAWGNGTLNSITEVEAALSKDQIAMPYVFSDAGVTNHIFTFPTKQTLLDMTINPATGAPRCFYVHWWDNPNPNASRFAGFNVNGRVPFNIRAMDMEENTPTPGRPIISPVQPGTTPVFPHEVNILNPVAYEKGWYNYSFPGVGTTFGPTQSGDGDLAYTGAPVIPVTMTIGGNGMSMFYGAWTDGNVAHEIAGNLVDYQYEN